MTFLDFEKAFDWVDRNTLGQVINRRGFPHHLITLYKAYIKKPVFKSTQERKWKLKADPAIILKTDVAFDTLLLADDQLIIQDSEDKLQKSVHLFNLLSKDYNLKMSISKTKVMAFKGKHSSPKNHDGWIDIRAS
jgi:hypothetical protein